MKKKTLKWLGITSGVILAYVIGSKVGSRRQKWRDIRELHESLKVADQNFFEKTGLNLMFGINEDTPLQIWGVFFRDPKKR